jgi:hypothetical protein
MASDRTSRRALALASCVFLAACGETPAPPLATSGSAAAAASASAPASAAAFVAPEGSAALPIDVVPWVGIPRPVADVEKVINREGLKPYDGKTGKLKGKITMKGDAAPDVKLELPAGCEAAANVYGKAFRVGEGGVLADALVAVTGYSGFVPVEKPYVSVTMKGCAYEQTVYTMTYGQRLEVKNVDPKLSHIPILDPAPFRSVNVAMPQGNAIKLYAYQPAVNYVLRDYMSRPFLTARVFNLQYATHDVSAIDGTYEITGIPVGKVKVNAFLPAIDNQPFDKEIEIKEGENTLDIELTFDAKKDKIASLGPDPWARPSGSAAGSAGAFGQPPRKYPSKTDHPR